MVSCAPATAARNASFSARRTAMTAASVIV